MHVGSHELGSFEADFPDAVREGKAVPCKNKRPHPVRVQIVEAHDERGRAEECFCILICSALVARRRFLGAW